MLLGDDWWTMREILLYLYSVSTTIHFFAIVVLPISLYWFGSNHSSKTVGIIGLSFLTVLFGLMCFIPFVTPENHEYVILPEVLYSGICFITLMIKWIPIVRRLPAEPLGG